MIRSLREMDNSIGWWAMWTVHGKDTSSFSLKWHHMKMLFKAFHKLLSGGLKNSTINSLPEKHINQLMTFNTEVGACLLFKSPRSLFW